MPHVPRKQPARRQSAAPLAAPPVAPAAQETAPPQTAPASVHVPTPVHQAHPQDQDPVVDGARRPAPDAARRSERSRRAIYDARSPSSVRSATARSRSKASRPVPGWASRRSTAGGRRRPRCCWRRSSTWVSRRLGRPAGGRPCFRTPATSRPTSGSCCGPPSTNSRTPRSSRPPALWPPRASLTKSSAPSSSPNCWSRSSAVRGPAARRPGDRRPRADLDPRIALELFVSPLAQRWLQRTGPVTHAYADTLVDYALYGLVPR